MIKKITKYYAYLCDKAYNKTLLTTLCWILLVTSILMIAVGILEFTLVYNTELDYFAERFFDKLKSPFLIFGVVFRSYVVMVVFGLIFCFGSANLLQGYGLGKLILEKAFLFLTYTSIVMTVYVIFHLVKILFEFSPMFGGGGCDIFCGFAIAMMIKSLLISMGNIAAMFLIYKYFKGVEVVES